MVKNIEKEAEGQTQEGLVMKSWAQAISAYYHISRKRKEEGKEAKGKKRRLSWDPCEWDPNDPEHTEHSDACKDCSFSPKRTLHLQGYSFPKRFILPQLENGGRLN